MAKVASTPTGRAHQPRAGTSSFEGPTHDHVGAPHSAAPPLQPARLSSSDRERDLERLRDEVFDLVVVGGGVTGAGIALDAATRGLSVALLEQRDLSAGTSSRSSKLIHGGLRYLEQLHFRLVREALRERRILLERLAPHLVKPVSFLLPLTRRGWDRFHVGLGLLLYDRLGGARHLPPHRHLTRRGALKVAPALRRDALVGAVRYWDAQVDDARFTVTLARTAATYGATVVTSARVTAFLREASHVVGVRVCDAETGSQLEVSARQVVNATGVWAEELENLAGRSSTRVRGSKGIHLVVPRDRIHADSGIVARTSTSFLFVVPWGRHWLIGTTDTDWNLDKAHPAASALDIQYLLDRVNLLLAVPLTHADIKGVYVGLRPLLHDESNAPARTSREHAVRQMIPGLHTIAGGKYTTYRVMAVDAVEAVARELHQHVPPSPTEHIALVGAEGHQALWNRRQSLADEAGLHVARVEHLLSRYGSVALELLQLISARPDLGDPLHGADEYLKAEALYAVSHEGALHLEDILTRRTRISIETWDRGLEAAEEVAELVAPLLDWDAETTRKEVTQYHARVAAERQSQLQSDDPTAHTIRVGTGDIRLSGTH